MIAQKLKYTFFLLMFLSVMFNAFSSSAESKPDVPDLIKSDLIEIGAEIWVKKEELKSIWAKLAAMGSEGRMKSHFQDDFLDVIDAVIDSLSDITTLLEYEAESIITIPHIMDKYKSFFSKLRIEKINHAKDLIRIEQKYINYIYSESEYKTTLWAVGDPRGKLESVLELLDKSISVLQSLEKKKAD